MLRMGGVIWSAYLTMMHELSSPEERTALLGRTDSVSPDEPRHGLNVALVWFAVNAMGVLRDESSVPTL